VYNNDLK
jgi:acyl dehydratase